MSLGVTVGLLVAAAVCALGVIGALLDRWAARQEHDAERSDGGERDSLIR